jgi:peptide/nickel transport system substrate-binding protein
MNMTKTSRITRRQFLQLSALTGTSLIAAACAAPASPTPAAPTAAPVPPAATSAATAAATSAATRAATAPPAPGTNLIGTLEGPAVLTDASKIPAAFKEAPALAQLVKDGKLPAVKDRLPSEPLVVQPVKEIGKYGGTWRRGFTGPADAENINRILSADKPLFWDFAGNKIMPSLARDWKVSDDGKTTTLFLRKGLKWSDCKPFTANDWVFWYEDIYGNKDITPTPHPDMLINGKPGALKMADDYTVVFEFPEANYLFEDLLAGSTFIGGGQSTRQSTGNAGGGYAPAHYLKQFHAKYAGAEQADKLAKDAKFDSWVTYFKNRIDYGLNPDLPTVGAWHTVQARNTAVHMLERNPYFWVVDTEGNQLPYMDKLQLTLAENLEVLNLRAIAGEYDWQERHTDMQKLPVFIENQQKGNYTVRLDPALNGSDATLHVSQTYSADEEIAKWLRTKEFRQALSMGINRDQLNETFWLGTGKPGNCLPDPTTPFSPGAEWNDKYAKYDATGANALLDKIGLTKKDADGFRQRSDGKGKLTLELVTVGGQFVPFTKHAEMIREQWRKIGVDATVKELERSLAFQRSKNNENQIMFWANDGSEFLFLFPRHALPVDPAECHMGQAIADWYASGGSKGMEPKDPDMRKALDMFKGASGKKRDERVKIAQDIWKLIAENLWTIGTVGRSPAFMGVRIVKNNMGNVPARQLNAQHARTPHSSLVESVFFKS